jgi:hypothetical protein
MLCSEPFCGQCPGSTKGLKFLLQHVCAILNTCHNAKNTVPSSFGSHCRLAYHFSLLLGTTQQKNKVLEIEEADDFLKSD